MAYKIKGDFGSFVDAF